MLLFCLRRICRRNHLWAVSLSVLMGAATVPLARSRTQLTIFCLVWVAYASTYLIRKGRLVTTSWPLASLCHLVDLKSSLLDPGVFPDPDRTFFPDPGSRSAENPGPIRKIPDPWKKRPKTVILRRKFVYFIFSTLDTVFFWLGSLKGTVAREFFGNWDYGVKG